jgi:phage terminase small subunit
VKGFAMLDKHKLFVSYYLGEAGADVTKAARMAQYADPHRNGARIVKRPDVQKAIQAALKRQALTAEDVLLGLADHATGNMADFTNIDPVTRQVSFDFAKAQRLGRMKLVKKLTIKPDGSTSIELYDAQSALTTIGKALNLFTERVHVTHVDDRADLRERILARLAERVKVPCDN